MATHIAVTPAGPIHIATLRTHPVISTKQPFAFGCRLLAYLRSRELYGIITSFIFATSIARGSPRKIDVSAPKRRQITVTQREKEGY